MSNVHHLPTARARAARQAQSVQPRPDTTVRTEPRRPSDSMLPSHVVTTADLVRMTIAGLLAGFVLGVFAAPLWNSVQPHLPKPVERAR